MENLGVAFLNSSTGNKLRLGKPLLLSRLDFSKRPLDFMELVMLPRLRRLDPPSEDFLDKRLCRVFLEMAERSDLSSLGVTVPLDLGVIVPLDLGSSSFIASGLKVNYCSSFLALPRVGVIVC